MKYPADELDKVGNIISIITDMADIEYNIFIVGNIAKLYPIGAVFEYKEAFPYVIYIA